MKKIICICGGSLFETVIDYQKGIFKQYEGIYIKRCKKCGLFRTIVENNTFNAKESQGEFYEQNRIRFKKIFSPIVNTLMKYKGLGSILDVGSSSGILMEEFQERGYDVFGTEPNKTAYKYAKKKFKNQIKNMTSTDFFKNTKRKFDVVIYNHVLEHIEDINKEFIMLKSHLKKGSVIVVGVPNIDNLIYKIRRERWESLMPREHIWHFSDEYMIKLLRKNHLNILKVQYSDQGREDYPLIKRLYFLFLRSLNAVFGKGEAVLIFAKYNG